MSVEFYNQYTQKHLLKAFNLRHFLLLRLLKKEIPKNKHGNLLELGCGTGIVSYMISQSFKKMSLVSIDYSNKSIEIAKKINFKNKNTHFICGDITQLNKFLSTNKFDYAVCFDVFEHIPKESLPVVIKSLSEKLNANAKLIINIPNPHLLKKLKEEKAENLQPIEEEIYAEDLIRICRKHNLFLTEFKEFNIWKNQESHYFVFEKREEFDFQPNEVTLTLKEKILRLKYYRSVRNSHSI